MMDRIKKKCFFGAALLHGLLLLVVVFGTAFFSSEEPVTSAQIIELIPDATITDGPTGGGNPRPAGDPNPAPPAPAPKPEVIPPKPAPEPEPVVEPTRAKPLEKDEVSEIPVITKKPVKPLPKPVVKPTEKPVQSKKLVDISQPKLRTPTDRKAANEKAEKIAQQNAERAAQRVANQRIAALNESIGGIKNNLSGATTIETGSGGSGGGAAAINYADLVLSKYDEAWFAPADVDDNEAIVKARVVIARNGSVVSATVIKPSRNATLDQSVRRALELKFIAPFPAGSSDSQRTYIINFNLKSKRGIG